MPKSKRSVKAGGAYYAKHGYSKALLVFLQPELHSKLKELAKTDERSMQAVARRILEEYFKIDR